MLSLSAKWFRHGETGDEKKKLEEGIRNARFTLDLLQEIIETDLKAETTPKRGDYDNPNWAYAQADRNGAIRAYNSVLTLIRQDDIKETDQKWKTKPKRQRKTKKPSSAPMQQLSL